MVLLPQHAAEHCCPLRGTQEAAPFLRAGTGHLHRAVMRKCVLACRWHAPQPVLHCPGKCVLFHTSLVCYIKVQSLSVTFSLFCRYPTVALISSLTTSMRQASWAPGPHTARLGWDCLAPLRALCSAEGCQIWHQKLGDLLTPGK